jgi:serine/threonine protein phosphatase PrpC
MLKKYCINSLLVVLLWTVNSLSNDAILLITNNLNKPIMVNIAPSDPEGAKRFLMDRFYVDAGLYLPIIQPGSEAFAGTLDGYNKYDVTIYDAYYGNIIINKRVSLASMEKLLVNNKDNAVEIVLERKSLDTQNSIDKLPDSNEIVPIYDQDDEVVPIYNPGASEKLSRIHALLTMMRMKFKGAARASAMYGMDVHGEASHKASKFDEDRWLIDESNPRYAIYGIFDGHRGRQVSEYCSLNMAKVIWEKLAKRYTETEALREAFLDIDAQVCKNLSKTGVAALVVLFDKLHNIVYTANAGDCRAILINGDQVRILSNDHTVKNAAEVQRVQRVGSAISLEPVDFVADHKYKIIPPAAGYLNAQLVPRLFGVLNTTRSIGDKDIKVKNRLALVAEPEITKTYVGSQQGALILASQGIWNVLSAPDVAFIASRVFLPTAGRIASELVKNAIKKGMKDDITALVVKIKAK